MEENNKTGRPKAFATPEDMQTAINRYFARCRAEDKPTTIEGLAVAIGVDRRTLLNYEKRAGYEAFFPTVKFAKDRVLADMVERGLGGYNNATLTIFLLKNNNGYEDKYDHGIKQEKVIRKLDRDEAAEILSDEQ